VQRAEDRDDRAPNFLGPAQKGRDLDQVLPGVTGEAAIGRVHEGERAVWKKAADKLRLIFDDIAEQFFLPLQLRGLEFEQRGNLLALGDFSAQVAVFSFYLATQPGKFEPRHQQ